MVERLKITGLIPHIVSSPSQLVPSEIGLYSIYNNPKFGSKSAIWYGLIWDKPAFFEKFVIFFRWCCLWSLGRHRPYYTSRERERESTSKSGNRIRMPSWRSHEDLTVLIRQQKSCIKKNSLRFVRFQKNGSLLVTVDSWIENQEPTTKDFCKKKPAVLVLTLVHWLQRFGTQNGNPGFIRFFPHWVGVE